MGNQPKDRSGKHRSDAELARMVAGVARTVAADAVICGVDTPDLVLDLLDMAGDLRVIAATLDPEAYDALARRGCDPLRLSIRTADPYKQGRYTISVAIRAGKISSGDLAVCAIGHRLCRGEADLIVVTDVEAGAVELAFSDLVSLTDGIRPNLLEAALRVACKIGSAARRGKPLGALFVLGDSDEVLKRSRQLVFNPFEGHESGERMLVDDGIHDMVMELAKLDGAFIVRGDGLIRTAGTFLAASEIQVEVPAGLGARHVAAAAITAVTSATAVAVSATDGHVRVFSGGELVLQMDPDLPPSGVGR